MAYLALGANLPTPHAGTDAKSAEWVPVQEALRQQERLAKGKFDLDDFRNHIVNMKKMGSMRDLMSKIPGLNQMGLDEVGGIDADEEIKRIKGIIDSMTPDEQSDPRVKTLAKLLTSPQVKQFIDTHYKGAVLPAF